MLRHISKQGIIALLFVYIAILRTSHAQSSLQSHVHTLERMDLAPIPTSPSTQQARCAQIGESAFMIGGVCATTNHHIPSTFLSVNIEKGWAQAKPLPAALSRRLGAMTTTHNNTLYICGGQLENEAVIFSDCYKSAPDYDMVYVGTSVLWGPRYGGVLVSFRGRLTILGGIVAGKVASKSIYTSPDDGHNWVPASTLLPMAMFNMVTAVYEGHLFLIGGYTRGEDMVYRDMHAVISTTDLSRWHNHDSIGTTAAGAQLVVHQWLGRMALILVVLEQDPLGTVHPLDDNQVTPPVPGLYVSVLPSTVTVTTKITLNWTRFPLYPFIFAEEKGPSSFCLYSQAGNLYLSGLPADRAIFNTTSRSLVYARELYEQATSFRIPQPGKCPGVILNDYVERTVIVNGSYTFVDDFSNATAPEIVTLTGAMYPGAVVNLTCPDGLHSIGAQTVTCLEVADAQPPKEDEPGVVYQNYLVERTIPYRDMTKLRYVWDKDPGSTYCTPSTCSRIVIHEVFGKVTYYPDKYGPTGFRARAVVECEPGYHLTGSREQLCGSNGQWQGEPPDCVDMCARDPSPCPEDTYCVPTVYRDKETYVCVPKRIDSVYSTDPQFEHVQLDGLPAADDVAFTSAPGLKIYNARDVSASYNMTFKLPQTKRSEGSPSSRDGYAGILSGAVTITPYVISRCKFIERRQPMPPAGILPITGSVFPFSINSTTEYSQITVPLSELSGDYWVPAMQVCVDVALGSQHRVPFKVHSSFEVSFTIHPHGDPTEQRVTLTRLRVCTMIHAVFILQLGLPKFIPGSVSLAQNGAMNTYLNLVSTDSFIITFLLDGGYPEPWVVVHYGPDEDRLKYMCRPAATAPAHSHPRWFLVSCSTQIGAEGTFLSLAGRIDIGIDSQTFYGTDVVSYPGDPTVFQIKGCTDVLRPDGYYATTDCPTDTLKPLPPGEVGPSQRIHLAITGKDIVPPTSVFIGGLKCLRNEDELPVNNTIWCVLPEGAGSIPFILVLTNHFSATVPAGMVRYAPPTITRVYGCGGFFSALHIFGCARAGGDTITLYGNNFGPDGATVYIGSEPCSEVVHAPALSAHGMVTCKTPPGIKKNRPVMIMQRAGQLSTSSQAVLSYEPCPKGTHMDEVVAGCSPCPAGMYSDSEGSDVCRSCPQGRYSLTERTVECTQCELGKFKQTTGIGVCTLCSTREYSSVPGASACMQCAPGYVSLPNRTECVACDRGKYASFVHSDGNVTNVTTDSTAAAAMRRRRRKGDGDDSAPILATHPASSYGESQYQTSSGVRLLDMSTSSTMATSDTTTTTSDESADNASTLLAATNRPWRSSFDAAVEEHASSHQLRVAGWDLKCLPCAVGHYNPSPAQAECLRCPENTFASAEGATLCRPCPTATTHRGFYCDATSGDIVNLEGVWTTTTVSPVSGDLEVVAVSCPKAGACRANKQCSQGRLPYEENILCGMCAPGYSEMNGECTPCEEYHPDILFQQLVLMIFTVLLIHIISQRPSNPDDLKNDRILPPDATLKIFFFFAQTSDFIVGTHDKWRALRTLAAIVSFSSTSGTCLAPMSQAADYLGVTLVPFAYFAILLCISLTHRLLRCPCVCRRRAPPQLDFNYPGNKPHGGDDDGVTDVDGADGGVSGLYEAPAPVMTHSNTFQALNHGDVDISRTETPAPSGYMSASTSFSRSFVIPVSRAVHPSSPSSLYPSTSTMYPTSPSTPMPTSASVLPSAPRRSSQIAVPQRRANLTPSASVVLSSSTVQDNLGMTVGPQSYYHSTMNLASQIGSSQRDEMLNGYRHAIAGTSADADAGDADAVPNKGSAAEATSPSTSTSTSTSPAQATSPATSSNPSAGPPGSKTGIAIGGSRPSPSVIASSDALSQAESALQLPEEQKNFGSPTKKSIDSSMNVGALNSTTNLLNNNDKISKDTTNDASAAAADTAPGAALDDAFRVNVADDYDVVDDVASYGLMCLCPCPFGRGSADCVCDCRMCGRYCVGPCAAMTYFPYPCAKVATVNHVCNLFAMCWRALCGVPDSATYLAVECNDHDSPATTHTAATTRTATAAAAIGPGYARLEEDLSRHQQGHSAPADYAMPKACSTGGTVPHRYQGSQRVFIDSDVDASRTVNDGTAKADAVDEGATLPLDLDQFNYVAQSTCPRRCCRLACYCLPAYDVVYIPNMKVPPFPVHAYWRSFIGLVLFSYSTLVNQTINYLLCVEIGPVRVVYSQPAIHCDSDVYRSMLPVFIVLLIIFVILLPLAVGFLVLYGKRKGILNSMRFGTVFGILYEQYHPRFAYWEVIALYRRSVYVLVDIVFFEDVRMKYAVFGFITIALYTVQLSVKPYFLLGDNFLEATALQTLLLITFLLTASATPLTYTNLIFMRILTEGTTLLLAIAVVVFRFRKYLPKATRALRVLARRIKYTCCGSCVTREGRGGEKGRKIRKGMLDDDDEDEPNWEEDGLGPSSSVSSYINIDSEPVFYMAGQRTNAGIQGKGKPVATMASSVSNISNWSVDVVSDMNLPTTRSFSRATHRLPLLQQGHVRVGARETPDEADLVYENEIEDVDLGNGFDRGSTLVDPGQQQQQQRNDNHGSHGLGNREVDEKSGLEAEGASDGMLMKSRSYFGSVGHQVSPSATAIAMTEPARRPSPNHLQQGESSGVAPVITFPSSSSSAAASAAAAAAPPAPPPAAAAAAPVGDAGARYDTPFEDEGWTNSEGNRTRATSVSTVRARHACSLAVSQNDARKFLSNEGDGGAADGQRLTSSSTSSSSINSDGTDDEEGSRSKRSCCRLFCCSFAGLALVGNFFLYVVSLGFREQPRVVYPCKCGSVSFYFFLHRRHKPGCTYEEEKETNAKSASLTVSSAPRNRMTSVSSKAGVVRSS